MSSAVAPGAASSSTTLWATASKEWVIPSKPKPGRKPKKETLQAKEGDEQTDDKGRRVQNRAAQRAFRERKQSQLAELQARLQAYEQGEIERNVALQNIAKRLKEENETLRQENTALKEKLSAYEEQTQQPTASSSALPPENEKKRGRDASASTSRKKSKVDVPEPQVASPYAGTPSPPDLVSSPESADTPDMRYSPVPLPAMEPVYTTHPSKPDAYEQHSAEPPMPAFDCGFCSDDTPCVCRIAFEQAAEGLAAEAQKMSNQPHLISFDKADMHSSILDNMPTYQPPVPLRRRNAGAPRNSIFAVAPAPPTCSGDPSNCAACASDTFGKAFCEALGESSEVAPPSVGRCADCPGDCDRMRGSSAPDAFSSGRGDEAEASTIPTNDAWMQLKSHPNIAFEDLSLLADVVSRRSKCTGPRVIISPAPGSITPERSSTPVDSQLSTEAPLQPAEAPFKEEIEPESEPEWRSSPEFRPSPDFRPPIFKEEERPMLVPQHILKTCGRRGMREVEVTAVQEALRLLDAKFRL